MKVLVLIIFFAFLMNPIAIWSCPSNPVKTGHSLDYTLSVLKRSDCYYAAGSFLNFAEICISKGRFSNAKWALDLAERKIQSKNSSLFYQWQAASASLFLERKRYEEAIHLLKPYVLQKNVYQKVPVEYRRRYHRLFIHAYYIRAKNRKDKNVDYLISLYKHRYRENIR